MAKSIPKLLGESFREIRREHCGTQEQCEERTGLSQSYISAVERGTSGFNSFETIGGAIEKMGVEPIELLRLAVARADGDDEYADLRLLWANADQDTRTAILILLRNLRRPA